MRYEDIELGDELPVEHPDISMEKILMFTEAAKTMCITRIDRLRRRRKR